MVAFLSQDLNVFFQCECSFVILLWSSMSSLGTKNNCHFLDKSWVPGNLHITWKFYPYKQAKPMFTQRITLKNWSQNCSEGERPDTRVQEPHKQRLSTVEIDFFSGWLSWVMFFSKIFPCAADDPVIHLLETCEVDGTRGPMIWFNDLLLTRLVLVIHICMRVKTCDSRGSVPGPYSELQAKTCRIYGDGMTNCSLFNLG